MTQEELLKSTIEYYSENPKKRRCINGNTCKYNPSIFHTTSEGCAIGRHLSQETRIKYDEQSFSKIRDIFLDESLKSMAPQWMQDMDINFLSKIQGLHDSESIWNSNGLSNFGKSEINSIINDFNLNYPKYEYDSITNTYK